MNVIAFDLSLTCTGVAYGEIDDISTVKLATITASKVMGARRLATIVDAVDTYIENCRPKIAVIEGYAMGVGRSGRLFDIGELGGVVKLTLFNYKIPCMIVPPTSLKLFVTGRGRAEKEDVQAVLHKWYGVKFRTSDEADAFGLFLMAGFRKRFLAGSRQWSLFEAESLHAKRKALAGCAFHL